MNKTANMTQKQKNAYEKWKIQIRLRRWEENGYSKYCIKCGDKILIVNNQRPCQELPNLCHDCVVKGTEETYLKVHSRRGRSELICIQCHNKFSLKNNERNVGKKFCCKSCAGKYNYHKDLKKSRERDRKRYKKYRYKRYSLLSPEKKKYWRIKQKQWIKTHTNEIKIYSKRRREKLKLLGIRKENRSRKLGIHGGSGISRKKVYTRHNGICIYCGSPVEYKEFHIDHYFPIAIIKKINDIFLHEKLTHYLNTHENLVCSCPKCNMEKSDKLPLNFIWEKAG